MIDQLWRPIAEEQLERLECGSPPTHRLVALPARLVAHTRLIGPLHSRLEDG